MSTPLVKKYETDIQVLKMQLQSVEAERDLYRTKYEAILLLSAHADLSQASFSASGDQTQDTIGADDEWSNLDNIWGEGEPGSDGDHNQHIKEINNKITEKANGGSSEGEEVDDSLIGRYISATFPGYGTFYGVLVTFSNPYYRVCYEDGDTEEMAEGEVLARLVDEDCPDLVAGGSIAKRISRSVAAFRACETDNDEQQEEERRDSSNKKGHKQSSAISTATGDAETKTIYVTYEVTEDMRQRVFASYLKGVQGQDISAIAKILYTPEQKAIMDDLRAEEEQQNIDIQTRKEKGKKGGGRGGGKGYDKSYHILQTYVQGEKMLVEWQRNTASMPGSQIDIFSRRWRIWYRAKVMPTSTLSNKHTNKHWSSGSSNQSRGEIRLHYLNWSKSHDECLTREDWEAAYIAPANTMLLMNDTGGNGDASNNKSRGAGKCGGKKRKSTCL